MKSIFFLLALFGVQLSAEAQKPDFAALAKARTVALVVKAESTVSCGDGSADSCLRNDSDIAAQVRKYIDATSIWNAFLEVDSKRADAILQFTIKNGKTTDGRITFEVRDADSNKIIYWEYRDVVLLENDITRIISHMLKVRAEAKSRPAK